MLAEIGEHAGLGGGAAGGKGKNFSRSAAMPSPVRAEVEIERSPVSKSRPGAPSFSEC